jgi:ubiquinone/menaquinone biosynthesis C-methylase UbiE
MLPLTERMLDLAGVRTGSRVLDVGAGTGEQTLMAAERVGRDGSVLAIDISASMLAVAADAAQEGDWQILRPRSWTPGESRNWSLRPLTPLFRVMR